MGENSTRKELAAIYLQDVTLFTSQSAAVFYDRLFSELDFTLPRAATGRLGFPKEAMVCAFIVMKCKGFSQITDLADYLNNNRLIAHYYGFNIMKPLPSYWTYNQFLKQNNPKSFAKDKFKPENHPISRPGLRLGRSFRVQPA